MVIGEMGILHPSIAKNIDKRKNFAVLELDVNKLLELKKTSNKIIPTSKFQSVSVDYNFVADEKMPYATIDKALSAIWKRHGALCIQLVALIAAEWALQSWRVL